MIVISEEAPLLKECRYSDFIVWGKLEDLPRLTQEVLANYQTYQDKIFNSKHFERRMRRLELSNYLKVQKVIQGSISILGTD